MLGGPSRRMFAGSGATNDHRHSGFECNFGFGRNSVRFNYAAANAGTAPI